MPGGNEFNVIGSHGKIVTLKATRTICNCCGNVIEPEEKFFAVRVPYDVGVTIPGQICKNCVRLAAKRMGVAR